LSSRIEFSSQVVESSFSTQLECSNSTSQFDSTLFQKNFNSTRHFSSQILDLNSSTRLDAISLYQWITILTSNWMKIADLKKNISASIYKQILEINEINENCMLLREAIARDETQYEDIKLKNCWTQNEILYHDSQLWVLFNELL